MTRSHRPVLLLLLSLVPATVFLGAGTVWNLEAERVRARDEAEGFARRAARAAGERIERDRELLLYDAVSAGRRLLERGETLKSVDVRLRPMVVVWDRDDRRVHPAPGRMVRREDVLAGLSPEWRREFDLYVALLARGDVDEAHALARPWATGGAPDALVAVAVSLEARARLDAVGPWAAAELLAALRQNGREAALPTAQRLWGMQVELGVAGGERAAEERIAVRAAEVLEPLLHDRVGLAPALAAELAADFTTPPVRRDFEARIERAQETGRRLARVAGEGPPPLPVGVWDRPQRVAVGDGWGASMRVSDAEDNLVGRVLAVAPGERSPEVSDLEAASWDVEFLASQDAPPSPPPASATVRWSCRWAATWPARPCAWFDARGTRRSPGARP